MDKITKTRKLPSVNIILPFPLPWNIDINNKVAILEIMIRKK